MEVLTGLLLGGGAANAVEALTLGGVTDFIGVRTAGIYSAGDVALDLGVALIPLTVWQAIGAHRLRIVVGTAAVAPVILLAVSGSRTGILVAYLTVLVAAAVGVTSLRKMI